MERIRKLVRAERPARAGVRLERSEMVEREMGFKRVWVGYNARRESDPEELDRLLAQVQRYHRLAAELLRNLRTLRARSSRFATVEQLREMRSKLFDRTMGLAAGLDLPDGVESDGKISR